VYNQSARAEIGGTINDDPAWRAVLRQDALSRFPIGLFTLDARGAVTYMNPEGYRLLGHLPEALVGCPLAEVLFASDQTRWEEALARAGAQEAPVYEACRLRGGGPEERWVQFRVRAIRDAGHLVGMAGACADVPTDGLDHCQLVRDEHLRMLLDHSSDIMSILGADDRPLYITPQALMRITGYTVKEYWHHPLTHYVHPDDLPEAMALAEAWRAHPPAEGVLVWRVRRKSEEYV